MQHFLVLFGFLLISSEFCSAQEWKLIADLKGKWKFQLGDDSSWVAPGYNDARWTEIAVPGEWEDQGYPGYDGFAWYRKKFVLPKNLSTQRLYLHLGYIDDVSEVFLNGHKVGAEGSFPPGFNTAFNTYQKIVIHPEYLNPTGENVLAIRVFDDQISGGFISGKVGFYEREDEIIPDFSLQGKWKFKAGDGLNRKEQILTENDWKEVLVPALWETQGFTNYNGIGWYRLAFKAPEKLIKEPLVLLLGRIDDVDETFLNGCFLGRTGKIGKDTQYNDEFRILRAYLIPPGSLTSDKDNIIAVRVFDNYLNGGIYDGPVGLITLEHFRSWAQKGKVADKSKWDFLFQ